jgi:hypothetical protein
VRATPSIASISMDIKDQVTLDCLELPATGRPLCVPPPPRCETMADGPWSFGSDDSVHSADHVDPEWLVRPKQRDPILAGCSLPELIEVQTPPPMRTNTMTTAKTSAARVETSSFSYWQGLVSAVPLALTVVLAGLIGFRLGARSSRRLSPADSLPARLEVCTAQEECAYLAMP